ncbi:PASTA domain-containing protein [Streptomyces sp. NPDC047042]|uniref:PASTA domain-containing protein n=1 Tax=Streptomyces sp. NPDC047042 TaxID=3154807 RepID=UPI0033D4CB7E
MRARTIAAGLGAVALLMLTACEGTDNSPSESSTAAQGASDQPKQDTSTTGAETETPDSATDAAPETATLPNLVGQDLQAAQDEAQAAGFYVLDDQDASGQGRLQILDRNWTVCSQEPAAGTHATDTPVILYAVKDDETC